MFVKHPLLFFVLFFVGGYFLAKILYIYKQHSQYNAHALDPILQQKIDEEYERELNYKKEKHDFDTSDLTNTEKNFRFYNFYSYPRLRFEECGKCLSICHNPTKKLDTGLLTCKGFSYKSFPQVVMKIITTAWETEHKRDRYVKQQYWLKFGKFYHKCNKAVFHILLDSAVNEGHYTANKRHQKINNLRVDGIFGTNSLKACQKENYPAKTFTKDRLQRAKKISEQKYKGKNFKGWKKRINRKLREYNQIKSKDFKY